jgi:hypothetical protein
MSIQRAVEVSFPTETDTIYTLQKTDNILGPWMTLETIVGNNTPVVRYYTATNMAQFYRALMTYTGPFLYTVYDGAVSITGYTSTNKNVIIPDTINGLPVTNIRYQAFFHKNITNVTIPDSVINLEFEAFVFCTDLISVTIGNSVTSIGDYAFYYCTNLTSVTIPNSVTNIGAETFRFCSSLTSVTIPNSVTSIGYAVFFYCTSLTSVTIPNSVTSIGDYSFKFCFSLTELYFDGNAPSLGVNVFSDTLATIYYLHEMAGWNETTTFGDRPAVCFNHPLSPTNKKGWKNK